jgi:O-antigen/teichoic acid export membrane protein
MFAVGNGIMQPLEQEVARAVAHRRAQGLGPAPVIRRAVTIGVGFSGVIALLSFATHTVVLDKWFDGDQVLSIAFVLGLFGFCAGHLSRGVLSSHHRFGAYARFFSVDGITRVLLCASLALLGVKAAGAYGLLLAASLFVGVGAALIGQRGLMDHGPAAPWSELTRNLGWLLLGTGSISLVVQSGTIAVDILATPDQQAAAGVFLNGLTTARIPLFLFQAILASLLPKLSRLAGTGHFDEFIGSLRRLVLLILAVGVVTTAVAGLLGPTFISVVYGAPNQTGGVPAMPLTGRDLALLAAAFILIMATICLDQALIALRGHSRMAIGWMIAFLTFVGVTALGSDLYLRVELGLLAASVVAFVWMSAFLTERLRHHVRLSAVGEAEALAELSVS